VTMQMWIPGLLYPEQQNMSCWLNHRVPMSTSKHGSYIKPCRCLFLPSACLEYLEENKIYIEYILQYTSRTNQNTFLL
jgi:hypothetical protein